MLAAIGRRILAAALAASMGLYPLGNAAGDESAGPTPKPYPEGINCVWMPLIDDYSLIDDAHIVFTGPGKTAYLATLTRRCFDLDTTLDIGLSSHGDQLCTGDAIIIDRDRCTIGSVEAVGSEAEAKMLVQARAAAEKARRQGNN